MEYSLRGTFKAVSQWLEKHAGFRLYAVALFVTMAVAYDLQVFNMGTYYDDWEGVFLYKQGFSALQIWDYFLRDRPFSSIIHIAFDPVLGASALGWHVLGLLLNWAAILFLVRALLQVWPRRTMEIGWIGLLLAVYPGLHRQFVVHTSLPHYASMFLFTLSLLLMVKAVRATHFRILLVAASVLLGIMQVLIIEYFAGLELVRILILYYIFREDAKTWKDAIKPALLAWLPYGLVFLCFLVYRFGLLSALQVTQAAPSHAIEVFSQLRQDPAGTVLHYTQNVAQDVLYSVFYVWSTAWVPQDLDLQSHIVLFSWPAGFLLAGLYAAVMWSWHKRGEPQSRPDYPWLVLGLCVSALLLGGLPIWIIDDRAVVGMWSDRFLFGQMFGAVPLVMLMLVGLSGANRKNIVNVVCAILVAGSLALQVRVADTYVQNWKYQRSFYWQLKWRAPSLKPGTFVMSTSAPFGLNDHYQIGYAINTIYNPGSGQTNQAYWWFNGPEKMWDTHTGAYKTGPVNETLRTITFDSDMQHALPVMYDKDGGRCLEVVDAVYAGEPLLDRTETQLFAVAHPALVTAKNIPMPQDVFGQEPVHDWCYFYEKADLARQYKQWDRVLQLWDAAGSSLSQLRYGPEYLPFIEAFAQKGNWAKAADLTLLAQKTTPNMPAMLCQNWSRILEQTAAGDARAAGFAKVQSALSCR